MRVSARRVAIVAGLVAGVYLAVVFSIRRVPDWVLQAIGGPGGVARDGGLVLRYRPPESYDLAKLERRAERRGATIRREAGELILEVPGVKREEANQIAAMSTRGRIEFREVLEDESMFKFRLESRDHKDTDLVAPGVHVSTDFWRPEDRPPHSTAYLIADNRRS